MRQERKGRDENAIDALLPGLAELRELVRKRRALGPTSETDSAVDDEIDHRARRLMDRFRDLARRSPD